jgi:ABC-type Mn2+/Zn2+ transport system ATPase subunit
VSLAVRRGEKVAVIGANGLGKSTLIKILAGRLAADQGSVKLGHEARVGYFAQDHHELLGDPKTTPLDFVWAALPDAPTALIRGELGRMLFSGDDAKKPIGSLSGGEGARVVFARIAVEKPNVLLLDEPTNHLDMEAIAALARSLKAYEGTTVFVSHDRWFVSEVATRVVEVTRTGLREFPGTFAEYLERSGDDHLDVDAVVLKAKAAKAQAAPVVAEAPAISWEEQKRRRNRQAALPRLRDEVLARIEEVESRRKEIAALFADPDFYGRTPQAEQDALMKEDREREEEVNELIAEWEELEAEIAAAT